MALIISNHIPLPNLSSWLHRAIGKLGNVVYHCVQKKGKCFAEKLVNICHKKKKNKLETFSVTIMEEKDILLWFRKDLL